MSASAAPISVTTSPPLRLLDLKASRGSVAVLHGVSFELAPGEATALLGRNGMGKTTTLDCIAGVLQASSGTLEVMGRPNRGCRPHDVMARGVGYVPENRGIFPRLSVADNLDVSRVPGSPWTVERLLALFPDLDGRLRERGGNLSGGQQQMLAIGRALSSNPALLMLDEPSAGLAPLVIRKIAAALDDILKTGVTLLLVEQSVAIASLIARRILVMDRGRIVADTTRTQLQDDKGLLDRHLGLAG